MSLPLVLVHGGGHGAWCWEPTQALLHAPALAPDLPPASIRGGPARYDAPAGIDDLTLADFGDAVIAAADAAGFDRFVLVGHSLGGLTLGEVGRRVPERIARLVFVSALVPEEGKNAVDALPPEMIERLAGGLDDAMIRHMFCNDMDDAQAQFVFDNTGTEVVQVMLEPITRAGLQGVPITYMRIRHDNGLPLVAQDASIERLRAHGPVDVIELDTGHDVMISRPEVLAPLLDALAEQAR